MTRSFKTTYWLWGSLLVMVFINIVLVFFMSRQKHEPPGKMGDAIIRELELDTKQQELFKGMREKHFMEMRRIDEERRLSKRALFNSIKDHLTDSVLSATTKHIGHLETEKDSLTYRHFEELRGICTEKQQTKLDQFLADFLERHARHRGPKPRDGHPERGNKNHNER